MQEKGPTLPDFLKVAVITTSLLATDGDYNEQIWRQLVDVAKAMAMTPPLFEATLKSVSVTTEVNDLKAFETRFRPNG